MGLPFSVTAVMVTMPALRFSSNPDAMTRMARGGLKVPVTNPPTLLPSSIAATRQ